MDDSRLVLLKQYFTWEMMRLGVLASDAHTSYLVHATDLHFQRWNEAKARYNEAQEIEKCVFTIVETTDNTD